MTGYVCVFRPGTRDGVIMSDGGQPYRFADSRHAGDLHGGDVVTFQPGLRRVRSRVHRAIDVRLVEKGYKRLAEAQRSQLQSFCRRLAPESMSV
jgi:hypothetical protein